MEFSLRSDTWKLPHYNARFDKHCPLHWKGEWDWRKIAELPRVTPVSPRTTKDSKKASPRTQSSISARIYSQKNRGRLPFPTQRNRPRTASHLPSEADNVEATQFFPQRNDNVKEELTEWLVKWSKPGIARRRTDALEDSNYTANKMKKRALTSLRKNSGARYYLNNRKDGVLDIEVKEMHEFSKPHHLRRNLNTPSKNKRIKYAVPPHLRGEEGWTREDTMHYLRGLHIGSAQQIEEALDEAINSYNPKATLKTKNITESEPVKRMQGANKNVYYVDTSQEVGPGKYLTSDEIKSNLERNTTEEDVAIFTTIHTKQARRTNNNRKQWEQDTDAAIKIQALQRGRQTRKKAAQRGGNKTACSYQHSGS